MPANEKSERVIVRTRIPADKKPSLEALAKRRGVSEAKLLRQLISSALMRSERKDRGTATDSSPTRRDRLTVALHPADRRALQERAAARNVTAGRYVTTLVRAHLNTQPRLPRDEAVMLRSATEELNAVRTTLNELVRAANAGAIWAEPLRETTEQLLTVFQKISFHLKEFARTNRRSWDAKITNRDL